MAGDILPVSAQEGPGEEEIRQGDRETGEGEPRAERSATPEPERLPQPEKVAGPASTARPGQPAARGLTLPQALATSLAQNPDLVALRGQVRINQAMVGVARTPIWNPFVQAQYFPSGSPFVPNKPGEPASGTGMSNYYIWVMQRFQIAHQREYRTRSALAALDQVQWNIFQGELLNVAQTTRLYFTALYQKEIHDLAEETAELNDRLARIVERRFQANLARAGDVTTARVAARQSRQQAELAQTTYRAALLALRQQLNLPLTAPLMPGEKLEDLQWLSLLPSDRPVEESLLASELIQGRPDVMAAQAGVRVFDANFQLARASRVPDLQTGPIYETGSDGTRYIGMRFQMDIPVWNNGAPLANQRRAERDQQQLTYEQLKVRASLEAQAAINQYEEVRQQLLKAKPVRPRATATELREMLRLFELGQADILAVLNTQTTLLQERRVCLDMLNQLAQAAAAVIQFTGLPPARVLHLPADSAGLRAGSCPTKPVLTLH